MLWLCIFFFLYIWLSLSLFWVPPSLIFCLRILFKTFLMCPATLEFVVHLHRCYLSPLWGGDASPEQAHSLQQLLNWRALVYSSLHAVWCPLFLLTPLSFPEPPSSFCVSCICISFNFLERFFWALCLGVLVLFLWYLCYLSAAPDWSIVIMAVSYVLPRMYTCLLIILGQLVTATPVVRGVRQTLWQQCLVRLKTGFKASKMAEGVLQHFPSKKT